MSAIKIDVTYEGLLALHGVARSNDTLPQWAELALDWAKQAQASVSALSAELDAIRREADTNQKWAFLEWRRRALVAEELLSEIQRSAKRPDPMSQALNEGDGVYRP